MANWNERPGWTNLTDIMLEQATRKVGLTAEQFNKVMHNLQHLKNNLGLANVEIGNIDTICTAPGTLFDVDIIHREVVYDVGITGTNGGPLVGTYEIGEKIDFFDFVFHVAVADITTQVSTTLSEDTENADVELVKTPLPSNTGYDFNFKFTIPRGIQGVKGVSFRSLGEYSAEVSYVNNDTYIDVVSYNGSLYCPKIEETTIGTLPTETSEWSLMVSKGDKGTSIINIEKTATNGLVDTYTMSFDDDATYTFTVTNGAEQDITGKADKVNNATNNHIASLDANGNLKDAGKSVNELETAIGNKISKVANPTAGNFAQLDANGNLVDSGKKASDFLTSHQDVSGKENSSNKVSSITSANMENETLYPNLKAVTSYVDAILGEIANEMSGV